MPAVRSATRALTALIGAILLLMWVGCSVVTEIPGTRTARVQEIGNVVLPVLAVLAFWDAARQGRPHR